MILTTNATRLIMEKAIICIHKEKDEELVYRTLAIIPRENVKYILTKEL